MEQLMSLGLLGSLISLIIGVVIFIKFISLCSDIYKIRTSIQDFTSYYYKMQEYKNNNDKS